MDATRHPHRYAPTVVFPFLLIGLGIVALLVNAGTITWDSLGRIAGLWPILLVVIGLELIVSRTLPAVIALATNIGISAVALLAAIGLMISGGSFGIAGWWPAAPGQTISRSAPVLDLQQATLNVSYGAARLNIHAAALGNDLYQAHITYAGNPAPSVRVDRSTSTVYVDRGNRGPFQVLPGGTHEQVDLVINNKIAWAITLNTGASQQTIDLRGLTLNSLRVNGGASSMEIDLPDPAGSMPVDINAGAMSLRLVAPNGAAARVNVSGGFSSLVCDGQSVSGFGHQTWESANYSAATNRIDVQFSGGASSVRLERW